MTYYHLVQQHRKRLPTVAPYDPNRFNPEMDEIKAELSIVEQRNLARAGFNAMYRTHGFELAYAKFRDGMNLKTPMETQLKKLRDELRSFQYSTVHARPKAEVEQELAALQKQAQRRARVRAKMNAKLQNEAKSPGSLIWHVAIHEASHFVIGELMGISVDHASIVPMEGKKRGESSLGHVLRRSDDARDESPLLFVIFLKAGRAAQLVLQPSFTQAFVDEWNRKGDFKNEHEIIAQYCRNDEQAMKRLDLELRTYTNRLVTNHWKTIVAVAETLLKKQTVDGYMLRKTARKSSGAPEETYHYGPMLFPQHSWDFPPVPLPNPRSKTKSGAA